MLAATEISSGQKTMNNYFDKYVDRITTGTNKKKVGLVAIIAVISFALCAAVFFWGAFYRIELKIFASGQVARSAKGGISILIQVENRFFEKVAGGQEVIIVDPDSDKKYDGFTIRDILPPQFENADYFEAVAVPDTPDPFLNVFPNGMKVKAIIVYKRILIFDVIMKKEI